MPRSETLLGGATGGGLGLLAPQVKVLAYAWVTGLWTPEAYEAGSAILTAVGMSVLGLLLVARERLVDDIESGRAGGLLRRAWRSLKPEARRTVISEDEQIVKGLEREG